MKILIGYCPPCKSYQIISYDFKEYLDKHNIPNWFIYRSTLAYPIMPVDYMIIFDSYIAQALIQWLFKRYLAQKIVLWGDFEGTPNLDILSKGFMNQNITIFTSKYQEECFKSIGIYGKAIIPRAINPQRLKPTSNRLVNKKYFLWIAGVDTRQKPESRKGEQGLIKIWKKYVEKHPDEYLVAVTDYPLELHLKNVIRFNFGDLNDNDIATLYKYAKAYLYTSHCEGFGMPPLEAMYMKCPLIYLDTPAVNEFAVGLKVNTDFVRKIPSIHGGYYNYYKFNVDEYVNRMEMIENSYIWDIVSEAYKKSLNYTTDKIFDRLMEVLK